MSVSRSRQVGPHTVGAVGLGAMTFDQSGAQPRDQLLDTLRAAVESWSDVGLALVDTADAYGPGADLGERAQGENERLVASLLDEAGLREHVLLATKAGHVRTDGGGWDTDSSAAHLRAAVDASLTRLGIDEIALWQHHRPDPDVSYDEVVQTLKAVHQAGKVRHIGLSNADPEQIRLAHGVLGDALVSVQNQYSPKFRTSAPEIDVCAELGLTFLAWSPLGGLNDAKELGDKHPAFAEVASERGVSPQQVALAWELATSPCVLPIPGAKRPASVRDSAAAVGLELSDHEMARLDAS
ncbi:aldo/keto reductase [Nocardioides acrostichi]|uniref:Aldo/keto reductase n=1 Tax=Nocardioides acrostichi TaxID=2784339 RepID=A0A930V0W5_9ACTN|nr:aldo/keto reductase [Nocardioides acrostichi]MBF4161999.1 aldo/keto reductase [Nocardioides acrostichi]